METLDTKNKIVNFLEEYARVNITDATNLFEDLRMVGDDAYYFIIEFANEFNVNFDEFPIEEYFPDDSIIPFYYLYVKFFKKENLRKKTFTLNHLVEVVKKGYWFEPVFSH